MGCNFECISGSNFFSPLCIVYCVLRIIGQCRETFCVCGVVTESLHAAMAHFDEEGWSVIEMCTLLLEKLQKTGGSTISCHLGDR